MLPCLQTKYAKYKKKMSFHHSQSEIFPLVPISCRWPLLKNRVFLFYLYHSTGYCQQQLTPPSSHLIGPSSIPGICSSFEELQPATLREHCIGFAIATQLRTDFCTVQHFAEWLMRAERFSALQVLDQLKERGGGGLRIIKQDKSSWLFLFQSLLTIETTLCDPIH